MRPPQTPRANAAGGGGNPRPWEWRWWNQVEQNPDRKPSKFVLPMALPSPTDEKSADAEDSAAVQRIIEHLPVEERAGFMRNLKRWAQLTIEERQTLRRQASERQQRMQEEMDNALRESGLHLDDDHREVFMLRYGQERRKLERELQEKLAAERARRTPELIQRLKREFEAIPASPSPAADSPVAVASPTVPSPTPTPRSGS